MGVRIIGTSVDEIRNTLKLGKTLYTIDELQQALQQEELGHNPVGKKRKTVVNMLSSAIKARQKELDNFYNSLL